ncbi:spermidine synthase [Pseudoduganella sp. RAF19]
MVIIYAATIFLSAFLLFQVQPVAGKMILPWFGGSAAVWTTCMLLFQVLLLLGYFYAHLTTRYLKPRRQAALHIALLVAAILTLPLAPSVYWKPDPASDPAMLLLGMLATTIGLPYFVLSSTGPLLQHWFAGERPGSVPYRLFALSNFGSMLGLLSFPLLFEPEFTMPQIAGGWSIGFIAFAACSASLALRSSKHVHHASPEAHFATAGGGTIGALSALSIGAGAQGSGPSTRDMLLWCILAAVPTVFLMAATSHLTANIAPMPLLWVLPLAIYLLTFILCFENPRWYQRRIFLPLLMILTPLLIGGIDHPSLLPRGIFWPIALYCAGVFAFCMSCHGELARLKPAPKHLTSFYLMIACGGALGGIFTALLAPRIFNDDYELPLACIATLIVVAAAIWKHEIGRGWAKVMLVSASLVTMMWGGTVFGPGSQEVKDRNFYGTIKVQEAMRGHDHVRQLEHGAIMHGYQYLDQARRRWPTAYFGTDSGAGIAVQAARDGAGERVGIIGLGAGTMAAYCQAGDVFRFYEINPLVSRFASSHFTYLRDCPGKVELALGDGRLTLESEAPQHFDLLMLDAFSGDAVPTHLLTREAFAIWFRHLKPDGVLAVQISNLYLNLAPVVSKMAAYYGRHAYIVSSHSNPARGTNAAKWVLIGPPERLARFSAAQPLAPSPNQRLWTDDYSSLAGILR